MSLNLELLTSENQLQWHTITSVTPEIQKKEIKPFVILAVKELEGTPDPRIATLVNKDKYAAVRAIVRHFTRLQSATKQWWSQDDIQAFLDTIKFSPECIAELLPFLCSEQLYHNIPKHLRVKPGLVGISWKIDVSLSQSNTERESLSSEEQKQIMHKDTYIILSLHMTDGTSQYYRLSIAKFHELRFSIANVLKNMIVLEKRKCMRND